MNCGFALKTAMLHRLHKVIYFPTKINFLKKPCHFFFLLLPNQHTFLTRLLFSRVFFPLVVAGRSGDDVCDRAPGRRVCVPLAARRHAGGEASAEECHVTLFHTGARAVAGGCPVDSSSGSNGNAKRDWFSIFGIELEQHLVLISTLCDFMWFSVVFEV